MNMLGKPIPSQASIAAHADDHEAICVAIAVAITRDGLNSGSVIRALDAAGFIIVRKGVHQSLRRMVETFRPFTLRPIGAPHSQARMDQEEQTAVHAEARRLVGLD